MVGSYILRRGSDHFRIIWPSMMMWRRRGRTSGWRNHGIRGGSGGDLFVSDESALTPNPALATVTAKGKYPRGSNDPGAAPPQREPRGRQQVMRLPRGWSRSGLSRRGVGPWRARAEAVWRSGWRLRSPATGLATRCASLSTTHSSTRPCSCSLIATRRIIRDGDQPLAPNVSCEDARRATTPGPGCPRSRRYRANGASPPSLRTGCRTRAGRPGRSRRNAPGHRSWASCRNNGSQPDCGRRSPRSRRCWCTPLARCTSP